MLAIKRFNLMVKASLLLLTVAVVFTSKAQGLNEFQLLKMQKTTLNDIRIFLNQERWNFNGVQSNQTFQYFDHSFNYDVVQWQNSASYSSEEAIILYSKPNKPNIVIYQAPYSHFQELLSTTSVKKSKTSISENLLSTFFHVGGITMEFREYNNDYSIRKYSILIYNSAAMKKEITNLAAAELLKEKEEKAKETKYQLSIEKGNELYALGDYNAAKFQYTLASQIDPEKDESREKIDICNDALGNEFIAKGDQELSKLNFESAINFYNKALNFGMNSQQIYSKIRGVNQTIKDSKVTSNLNIGTSLFANGDFDASLKIYKQVLALDPENQIAAMKIKEINSIKEILEKRKTTIFSYEQTNPLAFLSVKKSLNEILNSNIDKFGNGKIDLSYKISFDTLGTNKSSLMINESSIKGLDEYIRSSNPYSSLPSSKLGGYQVSSQEIVDLNIIWKTTKYKYKSNASGINALGTESSEKKLLESFINRQDLKYGTFTFSTKNKVINLSHFSDITLTNYSKSGGPLSFIYSMIMPGMGTLNVTHGQKGWGRFAWFLISAGTSIGSKMYSDKQYQNYIASSDQTASDDFYNKANIGNNFALASAGLAGTIYLYDVVWVFAKGFKNLKQTSSLRKQLGRSAIEIQKQPITIK